MRRHKLAPANASGLRRDGTAPDHRSPRSRAPGTTPAPEQTHAAPLPKTPTATAGLAHPAEQGPRRCAAAAPARRWPLLSRIRLGRIRLGRIGPAVLARIWGWR